MAASKMSLGIADNVAKDIRKTKGVQIQISRIIAAAKPPEAVDSQSM